MQVYAVGLLCAYVLPSAAPRYCRVWQRRAAGLWDDLDGPTCAQLDRIARAGGTGTLNKGAFAARPSTVTVNTATLQAVDATTNQRFELRRARFAADPQLISSQTRAARGS